MTEISGSCLCGSVSFKGDADVKLVGNCHCDDCRKATGSVYGTLVFVAKDQVEFSGNVSSYNHKSDSGSDMAKHFCGKCGSQLYGENSNRAGMVSLRAGVLDQKDIIQPSFNVYCDSAVGSTPMADGVKQFAKMPG